MLVDWGIGGIAMRIFIQALVLCLLLLGGSLLTSCGKTKPQTKPQGKPQTLSGVLTAPDGETPIPGATVYIPNSANSPSLAGNSANTNCEEPPENYLVYTCTGPDGSFSLDVKNLSGKVTLKFKKGSFEMTVDVDLQGSSGNLGKVEMSPDSANAAPKMAVVTGTYDRMQDVLAKLGFGSVNDLGRLELGTEKFDLYDGNGSLDTTYKEFYEIFNDNDGDGRADIYNYDIVFINCGNNYENFILKDQQKIAILKDFVSKGGRLYLTDWSYDFAEQVFPEYIDFLGSDATAEATPENMNEAQKGNSSYTEADILDDDLRAWLNTVSCQDSSGADVDCIDPSTGKVHIEGFLGGWAVINGPHPSRAGDVKVWVEGDVAWSTGSGIKPLTVTFKHGDGKVLYTSYHTKKDTSIKGLLPQERILQYLIFEVF